MPTGTTNFIQFNPAANNQETDSDYLADSQRTNGAINGELFNDKLANKLFYQLSTYIAAQAAMLANKGYSPNDASISALESVLANIVTFADLKSNLTSVAFSPTPTFNATNTNGFDIVLAGNVTSSTLTGTQVGQTLVFVVVQGVTPFSFSPPPNINDWLPVDMTPNSVTVQAFFIRQDGTIWSLFTEITKILNQISGLVSRGPLTTNSNGSYFEWSDGLIEAWGSVTLPATTGPLSAIAITFPTSFTSSPNLSLTVVNRPRSGTGWIATVSAQSVSSSGAQLDGQCSVPEGGGGSTFDQTVVVNWKAVGV